MIFHSCKSFFFFAAKNSQKSFFMAVNHFKKIISKWKCPEIVCKKIISKWKSFTYKVTFLKGKPFRGRKQLVSGVGNHFLGPYFSFKKVVVINLMGSRNHFLDPYFPLQNYW